ncbi:MAG: homocysteine S-methyltransferase family protein [Acidimicrobiia bacterium]|nr:homocysteine S-methyltransferase family protein [Acidimicrobiia bacterium]
MTIHRHDLPQANGQTLLTDGGLETTLIFDNGIDLPEFASFPLLDDEAGRAALLDYYRTYSDIARRHEVGIVLETPTWRASADWGDVLGYDESELARLNAAAVELLEEVRAAYEPTTTVVISGNVGPRGDGYEVGERMSVEEAERFHTAQISALAGAGADLVTALTMTYVEEATGFAQAAAAVGLPAVVSFTVETDGSLPTGQPLGEAIGAVESATGGSPIAYGINCAHPDHFVDTLTAAADAGEGWVDRIGLVRANASRMSHEELDNAEDLDVGDRAELGGLYADLKRLLPNLTVMGGCCGTDHGHIAEIANSTLAE